MEENKRTAPVATEAVNPYQFYEQNGFGTLHCHIYKKITQWCKDFSEYTVLKALKLAVQHDRRNYRYVNAILLDWAEKGTND